MPALILHWFFIGYWILNTGLDFYPGPFLFKPFSFQEDFLMIGLEGIIISVFPMKDCIGGKIQPATFLFEDLLIQRQTGTARSNYNKNVS